MRRGRAGGSEGGGRRPLGGCVFLVRELIAANSP